MSKLKDYQKKKHIVTIRLNDQLLKKIEEIAKKEKISVSDLIRHSVNIFLNKFKKE